MIQFESCYGYIANIHGIFITTTDGTDIYVNKSQLPFVRNHLEAAQLISVSFFVVSYETIFF